ncbi:MAG TPA: hypothetical protein VIG66_05260, partial [Noviherbaspirillum sp.]
RKKQLIAEARLHRTAVLLAREHLRAQVRPAAAVKEAAPGVAAAVLSAWLGSGLAQSLLARLPALLPVLVPAFAKLARRKGKGRLVLYAGIGAGVAAAVSLYLRRKR